jgi:hypothetical protein
MSGVSNTPPIARERSGLSICASSSEALRDTGEGARDLQMERQLDRGHSIPPSSCTSRPTRRVSFDRMAAENLCAHQATVTSEVLPLVAVRSSILCCSEGIRTGRGGFADHRPILLPVNQCECGISQPCLMSAGAKFWERNGQANLATHARMSFLGPCRRYIPAYPSPMEEVTTAPNPDFLMRLRGDAPSRWCRIGRPIES